MSSPRPVGEAPGWRKNAGEGGVPGEAGGGGGGDDENFAGRSLS